MYRVRFDAWNVTVTIPRQANALLFVNRSKRDYKPCATHAMELVKLAIGKPAGSEFDKQRRKRMKPALKVTG